MNTAILELGSNIQPRQNITYALESLEQRFIIRAKSFFRETAPLGDPHQPTFLNGAVLIETPEDLSKCKQILSGIESKLGRPITTDRYAARTIDFDIIVWNGQVIHQDFFDRDFVRETVLEVARQHEIQIKPLTPEKSSPSV